MLRVALIRHAKAQPHTEAANDHERSLDGRGRDDARDLGRRLVRLHVRPDLVLCSTARRTAETFEQINRAFDRPLRVVREPKIYEAPADRIMDLIWTAPEDVMFLALVGHNPGLEDGVRSLVDEEGHAAWEARGGSMPTCCAAIMDCDAASWRDLAPKSLRLVQVLTPSDKAD